MSSTPNPGQQMNEQIAKFWTDAFAQMGGAGFAQPQNSGQDAAKQMQRQFMDAMSQFLDGYMRSPQFLETLKQTMDNALTFKQQMDSFLANAMKSTGMPTREDSMAAVEAVVSMEKRIMRRLDEMNERIAALESDAAGSEGGSKKSTGRRAAR